MAGQHTNFKGTEERRAAEAPAKSSGTAAEGSTRLDNTKIKQQFMIKIKATEAVRRFNAELELADLATWGLCDRMEVDRLPHYLNQSGHEELSECLIAAGKAIGYFRGAPRERPQAAPVFETKGEFEPSRWTLGKEYQQRYEQSVRDNKALMEECRYLRDQLRALANQVQAAGLIVPPRVRECIR